VNSYKFYIILLLVNSVFAVKYWNGFYDITSQPLSNTLANAKRAFETKQFREAEDLIDKVLLMTNAPEFSIIDENNGPLNLQLIAAKIQYTGFPAGYSKINQKTINLVNETLKKYHKEAKGKNWAAYASFLMRKLRYLSRMAEK